MVCDLVGMWSGFVVAEADVHPAHFMLGPEILVRCLVLEGVEELGFASHSEFLLETPLDRHVHGLPEPGMAATAVGPEERPQAFFRAPLLKQEFAGTVEYEDRERAVENTNTVVARALWEATDHPIGFVDQDQFFILARDDLEF